MKIAFYTLGCKVNQYETQAMEEAMIKDGFIVVPHSEDADVYVINSCTVTAESDRKTRQTVRRFKSKHKNSIVVLTGCMPQAFPKESKELTEADIVIGNKNNNKLPELIDEYFKFPHRIIKIEEHKIGDKFVGGKISDFDGRTRANVKIEDGCNRFCSYCVIPYSRGRVRSKPIDELKEELKNLSDKGFKEVVLVGINLSAYGTDIGLTICDAVSEACKLDFERVRLGSLEPDHITDKVIEELSKEEKLCPQFHISLQSGCNKTLKAMNRHYTAEEYYELCKKLRSTFKDTTITTDIMTGFPTESDKDFEETAKFAEEIGFEKVHVFPYSPRHGTKAAQMEQLPRHIRDERAEELINRTDKVRKEFLKNQIGKSVSVLFERRHEDGFSVGYTKNYTPVKVKSEVRCGEILNVTITDSENDYCIATL